MQLNNKYNQQLQGYITIIIIMKLDKVYRLFNYNKI